MIGVPPSAAAVLRYIIKHPGCRSRDLQQRLNVNKQTIQNHLRCIRKAKLVVRVVVDRAVHLHPADPMPPWYEMTRAEAGARAARAQALARGASQSLATQARRERHERMMADDDYDLLPVTRSIVPAGEWQLDFPVPAPASIFNFRP